MVKVYFVRHCEAEGNKAKIFQGSTDCDISELGAKQLEFLKKRFENIHIDRAFSSPLIRAYKTAEAAVCGKGLEVIPLDGFTEIHGGVVEGRTFAESFEKYPELKQAWMKDIQNFAPTNGESMRQVYARAKTAFTELINDPENEGKTLLVASHGAVLKTLFCHLLFDDVERLAEVPWFDNTAVSLVVRNENGIRVEFFGDTDHLPEDCRPVSVVKLWDNKE